MTHAFGKDLTVGSIPKMLTRFAIPIFLANLLSSGYSIINTIWVGHLLGGNAVGAVALTFPIILLMVAVCAGATTATSVLVAQHFGARQHDAIQRIVNTSWSLALLLAALFVTGGLLGADALLRIMNTPPEIARLASSYLRLVFASVIFMYASFLIMSHE